MISEEANKPFDFDYFRAVRDRSLGRLLWRMKRYVDNIMEPRLHGMGFIDFKTSYLMVLGNIEEHGITNNELARRACVTKQAMSKVVNLLEQEGYIYTEKHATDSRSSVIFLNERGKELLWSVQLCVEEIKAKFCAILGEPRIGEMVETLYTLINALDKDPAPLR